MRNFDPIHCHAYDNHQLSDGKVEALLKRTRDAILRVRAGMQAMSSASGVAIEPVEQTRLLDTCSACPGVLGGGVPGGKLICGRPPPRWLG